MKSRKKIPANIQAKVRKRCGFACVICGSPMLIEIDHIEEYAKVKNHDENNLTLLCSNHHLEKTKGLLPKEIIIEANKNPFAIKNKETLPYTIKNLNSNEILVKLGSSNAIVSLIMNASDIIVVDKQPILSINYLNGRPLLSFKLYGENNNLLVSIINNEMKFLNDAYDINNIGTSLIVREKLGEILLDLDFESAGVINIKKALLKFNKRVLKINEIEIFFEGARFINGTFSGQIGLACGKMPEKGGVCIYMPGSKS